MQYLVVLVWGFYIKWDSNILCDFVFACVLRWVHIGVGGPPPSPSVPVLLSWCHHDYFMCHSAVDSIRTVVRLLLLHSASVTEFPGAHVGVSLRCVPNSGFLGICKYASFLYE